MRIRSAAHCAFHPLGSGARSLDSGCMDQHRKPSLRDRFRYRFDNFMSRGTGSLILGLFVISVILVVGAGLVVQVSGDLADQGLNFLDELRLGLEHALDSGFVESDQGSVLFLMVNLAVTFGGIFVVAILIGIISNGIQSRLEDLRKGRSRVIEQDHTVILGWNQQIFAVISELIEANANHRGACIVVLADVDKVEMEDAIRTRVGNTRGTRIVCRTGNPIDLAELEVANVQTSRSVVVLSPPSDDPDADVIKELLAIVNDPARRSAPYHVVAELRDQRNVAVAEMVGHDEVQLVLGGDLIARITAQTCRQPGLSVVYTELLDFEGDEIYMTEIPELVGVTFGESLSRFETSAVIGIMPAGGEPKLNPPMETRIGQGDQVIAVSRDDDTVVLRVGPGPVPDLGAIVEPKPREVGPERTLVLGWNWRAPLILTELDHYLAPGSEVLVVADSDDAGAAMEQLASSLQHQRITFQAGDTTDRRVLDALHEERFQHVIILSYSDSLDVQRADARTLVTLLHLRDIAARTGHAFSIVSEMLDLRNRALAEVTRADDFIVSDRLVSLYLSQISENRHLAEVFADLFDAEGSEVYLRPADDYVAAGHEVTFATVVEAARRRNEVAIGYRLRSQANESEHGYGVVVNPPKSRAVSFGEGDRIIVIAES
jgi:voltage-gated potassium channel Kch